jgi:opacity protein-like surface antigen
MNDLKPKGGGGSASFNTGARADVGLGYNINECFAVELETGVLWNEPKGGGGDLYQIPLLVNGIWNIQTHSAFTPYLGGGVGGAALKLDITDFGSDTAFTFAYQAIAGVKYALSEKLQLDLAYRFFGTLEPEWTINSTTQKFDPLFNQSVVASVTFKF